MYGRVTTCWDCEAQVLVEDDFPADVIKDLDSGEPHECPDTGSGPWKVCPSCYYLLEISEFESLGKGKVALECLKCSE